MASYLNIPGVVESEELLAVQPESDGVSFRITIAGGDTAVRLMRAASNGEHFDLVVLALDYQMLALDSVYVASATWSTHDRPYLEASLNAGEVRIV